MERLHAQCASQFRRRRLAHRHSIAIACHLCSPRAHQADAPAPAMARPKQSARAAAASEAPRPPKRARSVAAVLQGVAERVGQGGGARLVLAP